MAVLLLAVGQLLNSPL